MINKTSTLFVGIDIHKETHTLVGTNVACEKLCELTFENNNHGFSQALEQIMNTADNASLNPLIGLEDSGGNGLALANFFYKSGLPIKTVNPVLVQRNRRYQTHPEKSDPQDALEIAIVSVQKTDKLPDFTVTNNITFAKGLHILVKEREGLISEQTKTKNKLHWVLYQLWGIAYKTVYQKNVFGKRSLDFWLHYPSARSFKKTTRPLIAKPNWIIETALDDLPPVSDIEYQHAVRLLKRMQIIVEQVKEVDKELKRLVEENYAYLLSYPGCSVVTASKFIVYIKDINSFSSEKKLAKYAGIAPRKCESGQKKRDRSSMRGHSALRRAFKTVALSQIGRRGNQKAKEYYRKKIKEGKTKMQALKCLMRQNVKILFRIMKEQRPYY